MIFAIVSVPHNGTNFMIHTVTQSIKGLMHVDGTSHRRLTQFKGEHGYMLAHVLADSMPAIRKWSLEFPVLVPLRHPIRVAESWQGNGKSVAEMVDYYRRLIAVWNDYKGTDHALHCLPIDAPDRDERLAAINDALGLDLRTDWPVIMGHGEREPLNAHNRRLVDDLMEQYDAFFRTYYPPLVARDQRIADQEHALRA